MSNLAFKNSEKTYEKKDRETLWQVLANVKSFPKQVSVSVKLAGNESRFFEVNKELRFSCWMSHCFFFQQLQERCGMRKVHGQIAEKKRRQPSRQQKIH